MRLNLKRLGLLAGRAARVFAERAGTTPQRIDLMLLLRGFRLSQKEIAHRLCVSQPVVSRMLAALVDLGWVWRETVDYDRRYRIPRLTEAGQRRLALCFPEPTGYGAQATGELLWLRDWRNELAYLGLRVDSILRARLPRSFASFAAWSSRYREHRP